MPSLPPEEVRQNPRADHALGDDPFEDFDLSWLDAEPRATPDPAPEPDAPIPFPEPEAEPEPEPKPEPVTRADTELFSWLPPRVPADLDSPKPQPPPIPARESEAVAWLLAQERPDVTEMDIAEAKSTLDDWLAGEA